MRRQDARGGIEKPRARHHEHYADLARDMRVPKGHQRHSLLMARVDNADFVLHVVQACKHGIELHARNAKQNIDSVCHEALCNYFTTSEVCHMYSWLLNFKP